MSAAGLWSIHLPCAVVAVGVDEDFAAGIGGAEAAGFAAEAAEDDGVDYAKTRAGQHGDGELRDHGHVDGDAVAGFEFGEVAEHGGDFVDAAVEFLEGEDDGGFVFWFGDEDQRGFISVLGEVAVDAVVAGVEFAADEPFPERWIAGVEGGVPVVIPVEQIGVGAETFGEVFFAELVDEGGVVEIGLGDEFGGGVEVLFFFPVDGDLGFGEFAVGGSGVLRC